MKHREPLTRGERNLLIATTLFVAFIAALAWWWTSINAMPVVNIPTPQMPTPNARDYYIRACNLPAKGALESDTINKAFLNGRIIPGPPHPAGWTPANEDYAYPIGGAPKNYAAASPAPPNGGTAPKHVPDPITLGDVQQTLALKAGRVALLRQGFAYQYLNPPLRSFSTLLPELAQFREMARLLEVKASYQSAMRDEAGAVNTALDAVKFGTDIPRGGPMLFCFAGLAFEAIGRDNVWGRIKHLNAAQAYAASHRMEEIIQQRYPYNDSLFEEKYAAQAGLIEIFHQPRKEWIGESNGAELQQKLSIYTVSKQKVMDNYTHYMDTLIANGKQPYSTKAQNPPIPTDPICSILCPLYSKARLEFLVNETQDNLLLRSLALQAYHADHGSYPATLQPLVPAYLATLPADPFAAKGTFKYRRTPTAYLLYSIGPDGKDNGGTPSKDGQHRKGTGQPSTTSDSTGDIVAGVNVM